MPNKKCKICRKVVRGRSDKIFCSVNCKSIYHNKLTAANAPFTKRIDKILHRNRSILLEIMGKSTKQKTVPRIELDKKKFNYSYYTSTHINKKNKQVFQVYDFSYLIFTNQDVWIGRKLD